MPGPPIPIPNPRLPGGPVSPAPCYLPERAAALALTPLGEIEVVKVAAIRETAAGAARERQSRIARIPALGPVRPAAPAVMERSHGAAFGRLALFVLPWRPVVVRGRGPDRLVLLDVPSSAAPDAGRGARAADVRRSIQLDGTGRNLPP